MQLGDKVQKRNPEDVRFQVRSRLCAAAVFIVSLKSSEFKRHISACLSACNEEKTSASHLVPEQRLQALIALRLLVSAAETN